MNKLKVALVIVILGFLPIFASAARTVPGEVPVFEPLQPPPENTKPNISNSIQNGNPEPPGESEQEASTNTPKALEDIQQSIPLPLPQSHNSSWAWLITALIIILIGFGLGYWKHISKKG